MLIDMRPTLSKSGFEVLDMERLKDVLLDLPGLRGSKHYLEKTFWKNLTAFNYSASKIC